MNSIINHFHELEIGDIQQHENMVLAPLFGRESQLDYTVFDQAVRDGLQISETGSVPTLHFCNKTGREVLILQGEYVLGGKQNRMVAANVYLERGFDGNVPVRCVQQHRWQGDVGSAFDTSESIAPKSVMYATANQQAVWSRVSCLAQAHHVATPTQNLGDIFQEKKNETNRYLKSFSYTPESIGIVTAITTQGAKKYGVDVFDRHQTMEHHFRKLAESNALDALESRSAGATSVDDLIRFLGSIKACHFNERTPVSLGKDFQLQCHSAEGFALTYEEIPLYVTLASRFSHDAEPELPENIENIIFSPGRHPLLPPRTGYWRFR